MNRFLRALLLPIALFAFAASTVHPGVAPGALIALALWGVHVATSRLQFGYLGTDPAGTHSDGSLQFGSQDVDVETPDGVVTFTAEDISYEKGSKPLTRTDRFGVPVAEVLIDEIGTGSMTLQLPDADTKAPLIGAGFTLTDVGK